MSNIAIALKAEIARVARKEIRLETEALKRTITACRTEISLLKKRLQVLERQAKQASRMEARVARPELSSSGDAPPLRFSARRLAQLRQKLGLSAASFSRLIGVSALSVYKWESGQTRPRRAQLEAIAQVRKLGKREARARLETLQQ